MRIWRSVIEQQLPDRYWILIYALELTYDGDFGQDNGSLWRDRRRYPQHVRSSAMPALWPNTGTRMSTASIPRSQRSRLHLPTRSRSYRLLDLKEVRQLLERSDIPYGLVARSSHPFVNKL